MPRYIDADTLIQKIDGWRESIAETYGINDEYVKVLGDVLDIIEDAPTIEERQKGIWTTHEVACLLAEVIGDNCACNVNGNDEWLPIVCDFAQHECPNVVGVACWEQWLVHREEKTDD